MFYFVIYGYRRFNHLGRGLCSEPGVGHPPPSAPCRSPSVTSIVLYCIVLSVKPYIQKYCMVIACVASYMSHLSSYLSSMVRYTSNLSNMIRYSTNSIY